MTKTRQPFTNATMREPTPGKPHIALIGGWWRVSPWKRGTGALYYEAHAFARRLNNARPFGGLTMELIAIDELSE